MRDKPNPLIQLYHIRDIAAHDYKTKLAEMGKILEDKDDSFVFRHDDTVAKFSSYNTSFSLEIIQKEAFKQALILTPDAIKTKLDKSGKITLEGIYFDFDKATLKPASRKAILSVVALMQRYPDLILSINGYTDDKGSDGYNLKLSADRAAAVTAAIQAEGIKGLTPQLQRAWRKGSGRRQRHR
nr:OmpA family protein [uncultured Desulfobulbus sp.]